MTIDHHEVPRHDDESTDEERRARVFGDLVERLQRRENVDLEHVTRDHPEFSREFEALLTLAREVACPTARAVPTFPGYRVLRPIGRGGSGTVWLAHQESLGRNVALKVLSDVGPMSTTSRARFIDEARTLAQIQDDRIVAVHDVIEHDDGIAIAMDWIQGPTLRTLLKQLRDRPTDSPLEVTGKPLGVEPAALAPSWTLWVAQQGIRLAHALESLHAHGLVHRDVKPDNVLIGRDGRAILADFGLARDPDDPLDGRFSGTPVYAAPEQLRASRGEQLDGRADLYSLAATLYELLAREPPIVARNRDDLIRLVEAESAPPLRTRAKDVSADLATVIHKALASDRTRRYASAAAFAADLQRVLELRPIVAQPPSFLGRALRFTRRNRRALLPMALGLVVAGVASAFAIAELRRQMDTPRRAAELVRAAHSQLLVSSASAATDHLRVAIASYDRALALRSDRTAQMERDTVALAAMLLEVTESGAFAPLASEFAPRDQAGTDPFERTMHSAALRWLRIGSLESDPANLTRIPADYQHVLGLLAYLLDDARSAEACWTRFDPLSDPAPIAEAALGLMLCADGQHERAMPRLLRGVQTYPEASDLTVALVDAALALGDVNLARRTLQRLGTEIESASTHARRIEGDLAMISGDLDRAHTIFNLLTRENPRTPLPRVRLAALASKAGRPTDAVRILDGVVKDRPEVVRFRVQLAHAALAAGDIPRYLQQARFAVRRLATGTNDPSGVARDLLDILRIGGFRRLRSTAASQKNADNSVFPGEDGVSETMIRRPDHGALEVLTGRMAWMDRLEWNLPWSAERAVLEPMSAVVRSTLVLPELLASAMPQNWLSASLLAALAQSHRAWLDYAVVKEGWIALERALRVSAASEPSVMARLEARWTVPRRVSLEFLACADGRALPVIATSSATASKQHRVIRGLSLLGASKQGAKRVAQFDPDSFELMYDIRSDANKWHLGVQAATIPDIDGDGVHDLAVTEACLEPDPGLFSALSGRTGEVLWERPAHDPGSAACWSIDAIGDLDGDGIVDLAAGEPALFHPLKPVASVRAFSGDDGRTLLEVAGPATHACGAAVAAAGDIDGDGVPDLAIGAPHRSAGSGLVLVCSGRDGTTLRECRSPDNSSGFGTLLQSVGDLDGDERADLIVGETPSHGDRATRARLWAWSPGTGQILWTIESTQVDDDLGFDVAETPDLDDDGVVDLLIGAPRAGVGRRGAVELRSGRHGSRLAVWKGEHPEAWLGLAVAACAGERGPELLAVGCDRARRTVVFRLPLHRD